MAARSESAPSPGRPLAGRSASGSCRQGPLADSVRSEGNLPEQFQFYTDIQVKMEWNA